MVAARPIRGYGLKSGHSGFHSLKAGRFRDVGLLCCADERHNRVGEVESVHGAVVGAIVSFDQSRD